MNSIDAEALRMLEQYVDEYKISQKEYNRGHGRGKLC